MRAAAPAIDLVRARLELGGRAILSGITLSIEAEEFIGVLGPNGAGKTTLMRAILGLVPAAAGEIRVLGSPARRGNPAVGYMPQTRSNPAIGRISGHDFVASAAGGHRWGLPLLGAEGRREVARVLDLVEGTGLARRPLSEISAASGSGCCWPRRCSGSPGYCCWTSRSSASIRITSMAWWWRWCAGCRRSLASPCCSARMN